MIGLFRSKQPELLSHWYALIPDFQSSPKDFYSAVMKSLHDRQVPQMAISEEEVAEGGILSDKRVYLRMTRERLIFDVCAAPFGTSFFFSCRFWERPTIVKLWQVLLLAFALYIVASLSFNLFASIFGAWALFFWPIAFFGLLIGFAYTMRTAVMRGFKDVDATLQKIPVINAVYLAWFRKETYYRQDSRLLFRDTVNEVVKNIVEETVGAKGLKLIEYKDRGPILGELYTASKVTVDTAPPSRGETCPNLINT